jgi:hypothetical protein
VNESEEAQWYKTLGTESSEAHHPLNSSQYTEKCLFHAHLQRSDLKGPYLQHVQESTTSTMADVGYTSQNLEADNLMNLLSVVWISTQAKC